jgi:hypothetical protein
MQNMKIKRVLATVLGAVLLSSCVESALTLAEGGMSGTGISSGRITGFGSIYVNGVRYNVDQATFYREGELVSGQAAFSVGEFVTVTGVPAEDGSTSTATQVSFESLLVGDVTALSSDNVSITVMGQTVTTDDLTVLHGFTQLSELLVGNGVEVSGVRDAAGVITASSLTLRRDHYPNDGSLSKLAGNVSGLATAQTTFRLGDVLVDYATAQLEGFAAGTSLSNGMFVEVESRAALQGQRVVASKVRVKQPRADYPANTHLEMEGVVTALASTSRFTLNGQVVATTATTRFDGLSASGIGLNAALEVEGTLDASGVLQATRVALRHAQNMAGVRWQGAITSIDATQKTFSLLGSTFVVDQASMLLGDRDALNHQSTTAFALLNVGDTVEVEALLQADGTLKVLRLQRGHLLSPPPNAMNSSPVPPIRELGH